MNLLLIYLLGILAHYAAFNYNHKKDLKDIIDYPEVKEMEPLYTLFSFMWPVAWIVFLIMFLKELIKKK